MITTFFMRSTRMIGQVDSKNNVIVLSSSYEDNGFVSIFKIPEEVELFKSVVEDMHLSQIEVWEGDENVIKNMFNTIPIFVG